MIKQLDQEDILVTNADLLTEVNLEDFYLYHKNSKAHITILSIPYSVKVPFGVLETNNSELIKIIEKPTLTYLTNGGMYLIKQECLKLIPRNVFYNATDLIERVLNNKKYKISAYEYKGIWNDIGSHQDFNKVNYANYKDKL